MLTGDASAAAPGSSNQAAEPDPAAHRARAVTIWASYGPYHVARVDGLRRAGFEVTPFSYATLDPAYPFFRERPPGLIVLNATTLGQVNPALSFIRTLRSLLKVAPDLVLTCGYERPETLAAVIYCRLMWLFILSPRGRCVLMVENVRGTHRNAFVEGVKRWYLRAFDGFMVGGKQHIAYLQTLNISRDKIAVGYDCVDNDRIERLARDARERRTPPIPAPYLLTVSRLIKRKNTATIVRAFGDYVRSLPTTSQPFNLIIAGDGPERAALETLSHDLGVGQLVHFAGELAELDEAAFYYAFASAFILASWSEPWGLVINEAMAAGLPIVAARQVAAATDLVVDGVNGFTFDAPAHDALGVIFRRLHDMRPTLPTFGRASQAMVRRFSPDVFGKSAATFVSAGRVRARDSNR